LFSSVSLPMCSARVMLCNGTTLGGAMSTLRRVVSAHLNANPPSAESAQPIEPSEFSGSSEVSCSVHCSI
jgi:hypothetical protein